MQIFEAQYIKNRRDRLTAKLKTHLSADQAVLFFSGEPVQKPGGLDQTYPFLPHPEYFWLTGRRRASGVSFFSIDEGWIDFVKPISDEEKIWEGAVADDTYKNTRDVKDLKKFLAQKNFRELFKLGANAETQGSEKFAALQEAINQVRRIKDAAEVSLVESCARMALAGYQRIEKIIKPGVSEREIQLEYENAVLRAGAEKFPYDTIVGSGVNAAVLHAIPTTKKIQTGELVLIDAGADAHDYCVDITRVYAADGKFSSRQQEIYQIVLKAQEKSIAKCKLGVPWADVHYTAAFSMAEDLHHLGLIKDSAASACENGAISMFLPHGVGHMVGLKVRDVGGDVTRPPAFAAGARLRVNITLEENHLMTVEPGLYFISALLNQTERREKYRNSLDWQKIESWLDFGGIRIEDDILVTSAKPKNLTEVVPK